MPPATEWFANIDNLNTRRAYRNDLREFMTFAGISSPGELRLVTRAHVLAWRKDLERRQYRPYVFTGNGAAQAVNRPFSDHPPQTMTTLRRARRGRYPNGARAAPRWSRTVKSG